MSWYKILLLFYLCLRITVNYIYIHILIPSPYSKCTPNIKKELWWYPQQPQRFIFTCFSLQPSPEPSLQSSPEPSPEPNEPDLPLHQGLLEPSPEPSPEPCWTWPGFCTKASGTFPGTGSAPKPLRLLRDLLPNPTLLNLTRLCTSLPHLLWQPSPEPCWTWPDSAPKPAFSGCWTPTWLLHQSLPDLLQKLLRNLLQNLLNLTWLCAKASQTFSGTSEHSREPRWTWPGACTSAHLSYSGLKTPLAYAVGEKGIHFQFWETLETY